MSINNNLIDIDEINICYNCDGRGYMNGETCPICEGSGIMKDNIEKKDYKDLKND
jgi:DnaJ-class molecular chaperone